MTGAGGRSPARRVRAVAISGLFSALVAVTATWHFAAATRAPTPTAASVAQIEQYNHYVTLGNADRQSTPSWWKVNGAVMGPNMRSDGTVRVTLGPWVPDVASQDLKFYLAVDGQVQGGERQARPFGVYSAGKHLGGGLPNVEVIPVVEKNGVDAALSAPIVFNNTAFTDKTQATGTRT